ncbi:MAG: YihY/virulence factor BrkB family protein [Elusimicrobia bacterium]|nr:YihY/virulence factor BrkB family protein [Elusimicrobiota bacterium]
MSTRIWWGMLVKTVADWDGDNCQQKGAALAYYTLFSLSPLLLIAMALAGLAVGNGEIHDFVMAHIQSAIGPESARTIDAAILAIAQPVSSKVASAVGGVLLLLGASGVVAELRNSLNQIWKARPRESGLAIHIETQLLSLAFVLAAGLLLIASLALSAVAASLPKYFTGRMSLPACVLQSVNMAGSFSLITCLFAMIYKLLPETRIAWHDVWTGAAVTAFMLTIGNSFLGIYLGRFSRASSYGAAGAVVLILVWTYYCAQILYLGAEFTHVYAETRGSKK